MGGMKSRLLTLRCEGEVALYLKRASLFSRESLTKFVLSAALDRANGLRKSEAEEHPAWGAKQPPVLRDARRGSRKRGTQRARPPASGRKLCGCMGAGTQAT